MHTSLKMVGEVANMGTKTTEN